MRTTRIYDAVSRSIYKDKIFRYPNSRSDALVIFYKTLFNTLVNPQKSIDLKMYLKSWLKPIKKHSKMSAFFLIPNFNPVPFSICLSKFYE
jgi:hypothetical protein